MQETVTGGQAAAGPVLLQACDLSFGRDDIPLFSDLQLSLPQGQILLIEGDNGSGKTTLLRLLCGLLEPWAGEIRWRGRDVRTCYPDYLQSLCYIGHGNGVKHGLTARENLAVARALSGVVGRPDLAGILQRFGLDRHADAPAQSLSAGQRRRLALARLLLGGKRLWILDEPLTALDATGRTMLKTVFNEHLAQGGTVIMTSHDPFSLEGAPLVRMRLR
ncbi:MAG: cytochrome c biogenesis heme-transporting ATPase CcmA [Gammaproteobacteria bacterium]|jgi:heme exporter protein A